MKKKKGADDRQLGFDAMWGGGQQRLPEVPREPDRTMEQSAPVTPSEVEDREFAPRPSPSLEVNGTVSIREAANNDTAESRPPWSLDENVAILAGAGTGKTWTLVTMCLHLLGGARATKTVVPPHRLALLTFSEKAAGEMRDRLRARLDGLASGRSEEKELRASFARYELPFPKASFWRSVLDSLGTVTIGTFHAVCAQWVRQYSTSGFSAASQLLDEREAAELLADCAEREVLEQVEQANACVRDLLRERRFTGMNASGLVDNVVRIVRATREEGVDPRSIRLMSRDARLAEFNDALEQARRDLRAYIPTLSPSQKSRATAVRILELLEHATFDTYPSLSSELRQSGARLKAEHIRNYFSESSPDDAPTLHLLHAAVAIAPHEHEFLGLVHRVTERYRAILRELDSLDFTELLIAARDVLRDDLAARRDIQRRFHALVVDEYQDTNRVQFEIVTLLSEERKHGPRPLSQSVELATNELSALTLEPSFLAVVGDRKQAIYEFRGADVSVFERSASLIEKSGGRRWFLQRSYRSTPEIVQALNTLSMRFLGRESYDGTVLPFEVSYEPAHDHLEADRKSSSTRRPLLTLKTDFSKFDERGDDALRALEADALARLLAKTLEDSNELVIDRHTQKPRRLRGGDIAVLFRGFSNVELYRQALVRHGVRHRVIRGRGFFGAQEVVDVASLLRVLSNRFDALALIACLRGPWVGLADDSVLHVAATHDGVTLETLAERAPQLPEWESKRLTHFVQQVRSLRELSRHTSIEHVLEHALKAFDFRVAIAASPYGDQALSNIDKLLELAANRDKRHVSMASFAHELHALSEEQPLEAQGEVVDVQDSDAVTLCTVHQSKGLEWPVVVVPELFAKPKSDGGFALFDRDGGFALKPFDAPDVGKDGTRYRRQLASLRRRRALAEERRLVYVALTRARDRLVLGFIPPKQHKDSWASWLVRAAWADVKELIEEVDEATLPSSRSSVRGAAASDASAAAAVLERVRAPKPVTARELLLPVTQLQVFAECARRYELSFVLGVPEAGVEREEELESTERADSPSNDPRVLGTLTHRLLELTPLDEVGRPSLEQTLRDVGRSEDMPDEVLEVVVPWALGFWKTTFGRAMAARGEGALERELPFVMPIRGSNGLTVHLRGQVDLISSEGERVHVVDYKTSHRPKGDLESYRFQLDIYGRAARMLFPHASSVTTALVFLRDVNPEPVALPEGPPAEAHDAQLLALGEALISAQTRQSFEKRPLAYCQSIGCGFVSRCHGDQAKTRVVPLAT